MTFSGDIPPLLETKIIFLALTENSTSAEDKHSENEECLEGVKLQWEKRQLTIGVRKITTVNICMLPSKNTQEEIKAELICSLSMCNLGPHAFVLIVSRDQHFTERRGRTFQTALEILGDRIWDHSIICFKSSQNLLADSIEEHIESEGKVLQWLIKKSGNRYVHWTDNKSCWRKLLEKIDKLVALNGGKCFQVEAMRTNKTKQLDWAMEVQEVMEQMEENDLGAGSMLTPPKSEYSKVLASYIAGHHVTKTKISNFISYIQYSI